MSLKHCQESTRGRHIFNWGGVCVFCHEDKRSLQKRAKEIARAEIAKCREMLGRKVALAGLIERSEAT